MIVGLMGPIQSFLSFMQKGGFVLWPLLVLSVLSLSITIERIVFWARTSGGSARASGHAGRAGAQRGGPTQSQG